MRGGVVVNRSVCRFPQITSLRDFGKCRSNGESVGMPLSRWPRMESC